MASERELIQDARQDKLRELLFLFTNPLQSLEAFKARDSSQVGQDFYSANDIARNEPLNINLLPYVSDSQALKNELISALQTELFQPEHLKRPAESPEIERASKSRKTTMKDYPSRIMPVDSKQAVKKLAVTSLKSPVEALDAHMNEFLNKSILELDVIQVPENYPTEVHDVSSLAELYYLTQTLPLFKLLPGSHKTLMTENFELALLEGKIAVLYARIEELKRQKKWSLRQPIRYYDPYIYSKKNKKSKAYSWDILLDESKWLSTDFKESTKFKKACCFTIAQGIQDYWSYGKVMCIKRAPIKHVGESNKTNIVDQIMSEVETAEPTQRDSPSLKENATSPDNVEGMKTEKADIADTIDISKLLERPSPSSEITPPELPEYTKEDLEAAGISDVENVPFKTHADISDLRKVDQSIVRNLPRYSAFDGYESLLSSRKSTEFSIMPVSRMLHPMDSEQGWFKIILKDSKGAELGSSKISGPPEYQKGLFGSQHRRFNFLRPPKPPNVRNIEFRSPTIWLPQDDMHLIHYVAEFCFNWDLIAAHLNSHSATLKRYESNIERRTPWQCFERYIQLNEKFQFSDMKGINAYPAQQWLEHAHKAQLTTKRRISPLGVGNESIQRGHRKLRWASMFDAMRKTMRKREQALAKINHRRSANNSPDYGVASNAANGGRANDHIPSPAELLRLKFDRDRSKQETHMSQEATRARMLNAVSQLQKGQQGSAPAGPGMAHKSVQQQREQAHSAAVAAAAGVPQRRMSQAPNQLQGMQQRAQGAGMTTLGAGANLLRPQTVGPGSAPLLLQQQQLGPQASVVNDLKRPTTPNGTPYTKEQIQQLLLLQKQRRLMQQQNQAGSGGVAGSGNANMANLQGASAQGRKLQGYQANQQATGQSLSAAQSNAGVGGNTGAPSQAAMALGKRTGTPTKGRLQFAPAHVSAIINSIQQKNPNLTKEQVTKLAASYLANLQQQQQNRLHQQQLQQQSNQQLAPSQGATTRNAANMTAAQSVQQNLGLARQAHLQRQRMAEKEMDAQKLTKLQYEERKKLMMQNQQASSSSYVQGTSVGSPAMSSSPTPSGTKGRPLAQQRNYNRNQASKGNNGESS